MDDIGNYLTSAEAGELIGRTSVALRQACERGSIPDATRKGGIWLIPRESAVAYGRTAKRGRPSRPDANKGA